MTTHAAHCLSTLHTVYETLKGEFARTYFTFAIKLVVHQKRC